MFKKGDVVVCVDKGINCDITNGKEYTVDRRCQSDMIYLTDDTLSCREYYDFRFELKTAFKTVTKYAVVLVNNEYGEICENPIVCFRNTKRGVFDDVITAQKAKEELLIDYPKAIYVIATVTWEEPIPQEEIDIVEFNGKKYNREELSKALSLIKPLEN